MSTRASPVKKVTFPAQLRVRSEPHLGLKTKTLAPTKADSLNLTKPFKPAFVSLRTRYLGLGSRELTAKKTVKNWHHHKRVSNISVMSTGPSFYHETEEGVQPGDDTSLYTENSHNKVELQASLVTKTKFRTLNALATFLKNRKSLPTETVKFRKQKKKGGADEEVGGLQPHIHENSYETVVRLLREAQAHPLGLKRRQMKVLVDLPQLPFGRHVAYNSVSDFSKTHIVDIEPSAQLMDKVSNEIWIKKMERRRQTEPEAVHTNTKTAVPEVDFQTEELQLYNSKLKVAEENLYMHYSSGSKFWKRDLMEKQAGWRGLYRLELKRNSALNATTLN